MRVLSVNRSEPREVTLTGRTSVTGIVKEPVDGPVPVGPEGLEGDGVGNTKDHGGPDQALYLYGTGDLDWWAGQGLDVAPGLFGENLTVSGLASGEVEIGDRFDIGEVSLEATAPRIPCATLSARVGDGGFKDRFAAARRPGVYCRVLVGGRVRAGDTVAVIPGASGVTMVDGMDAYYDLRTPPDELRRLLGAPVASRLRTMLERRLDRSS